jgi:hypothetical protein
VKERDLFSAYGVFADDEDGRPLDINDWNWLAMEEIDLGDVHRGRIQCMAPGCPVMIAIWAQRRICRFHQKTYDASKLST